MVSQEGVPDDASNRAVDHRKRGQAIGDRDRQESRAGAGGLLRVVSRQGRTRRRRAVRPGSVGRDRHRRRRRAARAAPRLRRLQPHVAVDRRARADPRSRRQRRHHGGVHQRPAAGPGSQATGRGVRARRLVALRHGDQSGVGRAAEHRARRHLRSDRQGHHQRGGLHGRLRLARHGDTGGVRSADRRPRPPGDDGRGHGRVQRSRGDGGRRARRRARRRRSARPSTPRPRRTSTSARGRSRRAAWRGSRPAGRAGWAIGPWSS